MSIADRVRAIERDKGNAVHPLIVAERQPADPLHDHDGIRQQPGETCRMWAERYAATTGRAVILMAVGGQFDLYANSRGRPGRGWGLPRLAEDWGRFVDYFV